MDYKLLKKVLKAIPESKGQKAPTSAAQLSQGERIFVQTLSSELKKFNEFFMNREEEIVMKEGHLQQVFEQNEERIASALSAGAYSNDCLVADTHLCQKFANFHGELVMLEHWTNLNYAALVKILKKHDKRSNLSLRSPILGNVLQQPFYSTEVLLAMIGRAEERFRTLEHRIRGFMGASAGPPQALSEASAMNLIRISSDGSEISDDDEDGYSIEDTKVALNCWQGLEKSESMKNPLGTPASVAE